MTKEDAAATFKLQMTRIRNDYIERVPVELNQLVELASSIAKKPNHPQMKEMHARLHKLTGSAGTFGLTELSMKTRPIEQRLKRWQLQSINKINRKQLDDLCEQIKGLIPTLNQIEQIELEPIPTKRNVLANTNFVIWLVEDDKLLGLELARQIESFGYKMRLFTQLKDVEQAIKQETPDLILLDVIFEEENANSTEVLQLMPELNSAQCAVVFMSAYDDFDSRIHAARLGAEAFFLKPLDVPHLINRVVEISEKSRAIPQRVLIIEDDIRLAEHYCLVLQAAGMEAMVLQEPKTLVQKVISFRPELLLMDLYMPDYSGPELAGVIRQHENLTSLPIVFLSSETDLDKQIEAMEQGADDFLTKPISDKQLVAAVKVRVERSRKLESQITQDSLTGLLKHSTIKEAVEVEVSRAARNKVPLTVAMLDLDFFKAVNDNHGHAVGDVVICALAMLLRQRLRQYDIIGRYGGEEFVVVLPDCDAESGFQIIEDLRKHFNQIQFRNKDLFFNCSLSAGLASNIDFIECDGAELLVEADKALYQAKEKGRDRVEIAK